MARVAVRESVTLAGQAERARAVRTGTAVPGARCGDEALLTAARRAASEYQDQHGQPITGDALRACLGVFNQAASELLRQLRAAAGRPPDARAA
jgi:hypothetical protein